MTAYGRGSCFSLLGKWVVEIHSVNKKGLDIYIGMSKDLLSFDLEIRKQLSTQVHRGQVTVKVSFESEAGEADIARLRRFKQTLETVCEDLKFPSEQITFPFLYAEAKKTTFQLEGYEEAAWKDLFSALQEALLAFIDMRYREGKALTAAFERHLEMLKNLLSEVEEKSSGMEERYRKKMIEKLEQFKDLLSEDKDRVLREAFFYAEKADVTEEIVRLKSHFEQFADLLRLEEKSVGRAMDFLVQEMGREINTLSSKSDDIEVSAAALKMKAELEKIREQVQNVE